MADTTLAPVEAPQNVVSALNMMGTSGAMECYRRRPRKERAKCESHIGTVLGFGLALVALV